MLGPKHLCDVEPVGRLWIHCPSEFQTRMSFLFLNRFLNIISMCFHVFRIVVNGINKLEVPLFSFGSKIPNPIFWLHFSPWWHGPHCCKVTLLLLASARYILHVESYVLLSEPQTTLLSAHLQSASWLSWSFFTKKSNHIFLLYKPCSLQSKSMS